MCFEKFVPDKSGDDGQSASCQGVDRGHPVRREMLLALKSGNFGDPELFSDALELMR